MTTTSVDAATTAARTSEPRQAAPGAGFATTAITTSRHTVLQLFRTPQILFMGSIQGALFLFMFRYVFGGAISTGDQLSYVNFLVPGFLVTVILWSGMSAAAGVAEDSATGVYDLMAKVYIPDDQDTGHYLSSRLFDIPGIQRTLTTMTFKAF